MAQSKKKTTMKLAAHPPSLEAIAKAARVSIATASLALNDHARVADRTKIRVREAAAKLDYIPNQAARRLARGAGRRRRAIEQVGFIIFDRHWHERGVAESYLALMRGVEQELATHDATMLFLRVGSEQEYSKVSRLIRAGRVDAWLVTGTVDESALEIVSDDRTPFVVLGTHSSSRVVHTVDVNFYDIGKIAVEHIAALGHRRIGFVGSSMRLKYQRSVLSGFRDTVAALGLDGADELISTNEGHPSDRPLEPRIDALLNLPRKPTAIFSGEPGQVAHIADLFRFRGLRVPEDFSLVGSLLAPAAPAISGALSPLARVEYPLVEVGRAGASLLREVVEQGETAPRQIQITPSFFPGRSCAAPNVD